MLLPGTDPESYITEQYTKINNVIGAPQATAAGSRVAVATRVAAAAVTRAVVAAVIPKLQTPNPTPQTRNPKPETRNPKPQALHTKHETRKHTHPESTLRLKRSEQRRVAGMCERGPQGYGYRVTSLIRNHRILGPYSRPMSRALRWSYGGGSFL